MSNVMNSVVKEICDSMQNNPDRWEITTYSLNDKKSGLKYWLDDTTIVCTWNGLSKDLVFTSTQGKKVFQAMNLMKEYKASVAQEKVIASFKVRAKEDTSHKSWWEFWK